MVVLIVASFVVLALGSAGVAALALALVLVVASRFASRPAEDEVPVAPPGLRAGRIGDPAAKPSGRVPKGWSERCRAAAPSTLRLPRGRIARAA